MTEAWQGGSSEPSPQKLTKQPPANGSPCSKRHDGQVPIPQVTDPQHGPGAAPPGIFQHRGIPEATRANPSPGGGHPASPRDFPGLWRSPPPTAAPGPLSG